MITYGQLQLMKGLRGHNCPYCTGGKIEEEKPAQKIAASPAKQYLSPKDESPKFKDKTEVSKKKVSPENCLQTINPNLAKQWHPTKNGSLTPKDVTVFSSNQVWWRCANGHEWKAAVPPETAGRAVSTAITCIEASANRIKYHENRRTVFLINLTKNAHLTGLYTLSLTQLFCIKIAI